MRTGEHKVAAVTRTFYVRTRVGSRLNGGADERTQVNTSTLKPPGLRPRNVQHLDRVAIGLDAPHAPLLGGLSQAMSNGLVKATAMGPTKARIQRILGPPRVDAIKHKHKHKNTFREEVGLSWVELWLRSSGLQPPDGRSNGQK